MLDKERSQVPGHSRLAVLQGSESLVERFLTRVRHAPNAIVAEGADGTLSMGALGRQAAFTAKVLEQSEPGSIVGVYAHPGFELLVGLWGALLAGAAYCPLSPDYPEDRIRQMIEDSGMRSIVCSTRLEKRVRDIAGPNVRTIVLSGGEAATLDLRDAAKAQGDDLAYVIFTSGSTGRPKGVMIEHRNISSQMNWFDKTFGLGAGTVILQKTSFSFDAAQWELLASAFGSRLIFGSVNSFRDPLEQIRLIRRYNVTMLQCVPTLWRSLVETEKLGTCKTLRFLFSGGEALPRELARACLKALPESRLVNLYGPTECTINATSFEVSESWLANGQNTVPIGFPVDGLRLSILDEEGNQVSQGGQGEIYLEGEQVGRGYLGREDLTRERFRSGYTEKGEWCYRTGDMGLQNPDGSVQFLSRADGQIKLRGYRIELDEIRSTIENHDWVKAAGVFVRHDGRTGADALIACVELSASQAQLMDAGVADDHHRSKASKIQVKAQLSSLGVRQADELGPSRIGLPGKDATEAQASRVFGRKSYRHFEGDGRPNVADLARLLSVASTTGAGRQLTAIALDELGHLLRYLGQFHSNERLLPKYAYASPGALYAVQIYLDLSDVAGLEPGIYYYHPSEHALYLTSSRPRSSKPKFSVHFVGKNRAIAPIYKLNIREVLDFEVGHILGLLDATLDDLGLAVGYPFSEPSIMSDVAAETDDHYLGSFIVSGQPDESWIGPAVNAYLQPHGGSLEGIPPGLHHFSDGRFEKVSSSVIERRHLVAINQRMYDRSAFGIALCIEEYLGDLAFISLGRKLQRLQMNEANYGFMSSGYSSNSGHDQRVAIRLQDILGERPGATYFCIGGRVSDAQIHDRGMKEDAVHTKGPAELISEDLKTLLPAYMQPNHVILVDNIPLSANGKVDVKTLKGLIDLDKLMAEKPVIGPRNELERQIAVHWSASLHTDRISVEDQFFERGGDSLMAINLVCRINEELDIDLPLETLFEASTIAELAEKVKAFTPSSRSRLLPLTPGSGRPIFCWPGLGGYPMNLREFAKQIAYEDRPVMGVQALGLNAFEHPVSNVADMAALDVAEIRAMQPAGKYTLIGYSFGARLAFETACQLEALGEQIDHLILIAPGNPRIRMVDQAAKGSADFDNPAYVAVLLSVFTQRLGGVELDECLATVRSLEDFVAFIAGHIDALDVKTIERITRVAKQCYDTTYRFEELIGRRVNAPVTLCKAAGDDYSFIEAKTDYSVLPPRTFDVPIDHYQLLKPGGVEMVASRILDILKGEAKDELHGKAFRRTAGLSISGNFSGDANPFLWVSPEIRQAQLDGRPVIALESNVLAHGLPYPDNLATLVEMKRVIAEAGAVSATTAVYDGKLLVGASESQLEFFASTRGLAKVSSRDLPMALASGEPAVTTVAASLVAAELAGIKFFASAGLGGVHRGAETSFDISSDLIQITRSPVVAVTAGVKKILDLALTLEFLETFCVPCVTYRFDDFPAFYVRSSGYPSPCRMDSLEEIAAAIGIHEQLSHGGFIVAAPTLESDAIDEGVIEAAIVEATERATRQGIAGKPLTKYIMRAVNAATEGRADAANAAVLVSNARFAAELAVAYTRLQSPSSCGVQKRWGV